MNTQTRTRYSVQSILTNAFYQAPKFLSQGDFKKLSSDAKWLYTLMLDRNRLSIKNNWTDSNGDVYIIFQRDQMSEQMGLSRNTITKIVNELKAVALVEEQTQGHNRPNKIYVQAPVFTQDNTFDPDHADEPRVNDMDDCKQNDSYTEPDCINDVLQCNQRPGTNIPLQPAKTLGAQNLRTQAPNICASRGANFMHQDAQVLTTSNNNFNNNNFNKMSVSNSRHQSDQTEPLAYGEFKTVTLTYTEYTKLTERFPLQTVDDYIQRIDNHQAKSGKVYINHYAAIVDWITTDMRKKAEDAIKFAKRKHKNLFCNFPERDNDSVYEAVEEYQRQELLAQLVIS